MLAILLLPFSCFQKIENDWAKNLKTFELLRPVCSNFTSSFQPIISRYKVLLGRKEILLQIVKKLTVDKPKLRKNLEPTKRFQDFY